MVVFQHRFSHPSSTVTTGDRDHWSGDGDARELAAAAGLADTADADDAVIGMDRWMYGLPL